MNNELGSLDFETYSEAGHVWNEEARKWVTPVGARKKGLNVVGVTAYAEHHSTEVLTLSYRHPGEAQIRRWRPGEPPPQDLFDRLACGGVYKAHNFFFEMSIWEKVCTTRYGWPSIMPWRYQFRCTMATARVNSFPGSLGDLSTVLQLPTPKDAEGKKLLDELSVPRNPTKADLRWRITPADAPDRFARLQDYCDTDIVAEEGAYSRCLPMSDDELYFWWVDQEINWRGIAVDHAGIHNCIAILDAVFEKYVAECEALTGFKPTQTGALLGWIAAKGLRLPNMRADTLATALGPDFTYELSLQEDDEEDLGHYTDNGPPIVTAAEMPQEVRRALELRVLTASASVKKLYAMALRVSRDGRLTNLIIHHGARTGRPTGDSVQPLNMPRSGPDLRWCDQPDCHRPFAYTHAKCPWCDAPANPAWKTKWSGRPKGLPDTVPSAVDFVLEVIENRDLELVEWFFGDALACLAGCIRGLFTAGPGMELIASDYSAIETVVTAALAGEEWRLDVIRSGVDIYLAGASTITGRTLAEYEAYKAAHQEAHPDRQKIGKVSELACGFGGWVGALRAFGYEGSDEEAKRIILAWRKASPNIVEMWGGQFRGAPWDPASRQEYYGFEGCAVQAILYPGAPFEYRGIRFEVRDHPAGWPAMFVRLLSGRELTYHRPSLQQSTRPHARAGEYSITYWTWNTNTKYGPRGWVPMGTFGGRLTENIVQATAHDIQRYGIKALRMAGYPTVLHVYDENVAEVPAGTGSIEEFERIMSTMPPYAATWPIKAAGGWRGRRYRKG